MPPSGLQDLADVLSDVLKAVAGTPLEFQISVTLGGGETVPPETVDAIDELLTGVSEELRLKA
jgi:hypothetical protein